MARIIPVGYGEAAVFYTSTQGTSPFVCTMGIDLQTFGQGDYVTVANSVHTAWKNKFASLTSNALFIDHVELAVGLSGGTSGSVLSTTAGVAGVFTGAMAPVGAAAVARKTTEDLGRKGRGRCFIPGVVKASDVAFGGQLSTALRASLATAWTGLIADLNTEGGDVYAPAVLIHNNPALVPTPIIGGAISEKIGYVRGRVY